MKSPLEHIVIVGGGTAGWLTAAILAAEHSIDPKTGAFRITLIESPDISTIGVGEGTWPSMRTSLKKIGISETDFFRQCNASFKQGTQFHNWIQQLDAGYAHPFTLPQSFADANLARPWQQAQRPVPFAEAVCPQLPLFERHLAPKQISTPEYACHLNYGYHLDAAKFADMLRVHAVEKLGITHLRDVIFDRTLCKRKLGWGDHMAHSVSCVLHIAMTGPETQSWLRSRGAVDLLVNLNKPTCRLACDEASPPFMPNHIRTAVLQALGCANPPPVHVVSKPGARVCSQCPKPAASKCSRCKLVWYCGRGCQLAHWKAGHKSSCGK